MDKKYSTNEDAARIVGFRNIPFGALIINTPCEEGYHCPVCKYDAIVDEEFDMRLDWSEYNGFLYCHICNRDYPTCLCKPDDVEEEIKLYIAIVEEAIKRSHDRT